MCTCGACQVPQANLTLSWTNAISGPGSTTLDFQSCILWNTGCVNQLLFELQCLSGVLIFTVIFFISGSCPTGQHRQCASNGGAGGKLDSVMQTCGAGFLWELSVNGTDCPGVFAGGYTSFTISA
jgi:hypothetical protein